MSQPAITEEQYKLWLDQMEPWLKSANTVWYAMESAGIIHHKNAIYSKMKLKDWFGEKIDALRRMPGELINSTFHRLIVGINEKVMRKEPLTSDEIKLLIAYAEKHRSAQPFFVNRTETATGKSVDEVLDELDKKVENKDDVATEIRKQVVETQPSVPDQEQTGPSGNVPPQPNTAPTPTGQ